MSTTHTPGPWHVDPLRAMVNDEGSLPICLLQWPSDERTEVVTKANARLIAAAPELMEALRGILAITDRDHAAWDKARAAIAKATGEGEA